MHSTNLRFENKAGGTRCAKSYFLNNEEIRQFVKSERLGEGSEVTVGGAALLLRPQAEGFSTQS